MLALGFCSIDTAPTYKNEDKVGEALKNSSNSSRGDDGIFLIAKVPKRATDAEQVREEFEKTLKELDRDSVDLLLLHWPSDVIARNTLQQVWACMEGFVREKRCRALGVCNFNEGALMKLLRCCTIPPVLNQVERHPLLPQFALLDFCARHNIWVQAHTPLGGTRSSSHNSVNNENEILEHAVVKRVARETGLTPAQVVVRWNLQQGVLVVTKCSEEDHAKEILSCIGIDTDIDQSDDNDSDDDNDTKTVKSTISPKLSLSPNYMKALDSCLLGDKEENKTTSTKRFVAPPFMYGSKAVYCWGERMPQR